MIKLYNLLFVQLLLSFFLFIDLVFILFKSFYCTTSLDSFQFDCIPFTNTGKWVYFVFYMVDIRRIINFSLIIILGFSNIYAYFPHPSPIPFDMCRHGLDNLSISRKRIFHEIPIWLTFFIGKIDSLYDIIHKKISVFDMIMSLICSFFFMIFLSISSRKECTDRPMVRISLMMGLLYYVVEWILNILEISSNVINAKEEEIEIIYLFTTSFHLIYNSAICSLTWEKWIFPEKDLTNI